MPSGATEHRCGSGHHAERSAEGEARAESRHPPRSGYPVPVHNPSSDARLRARRCDGYMRRSAPSSRRSLTIDRRGGRRRHDGSRDKKDSDSDAVRRKATRRHRCDSAGTGTLDCVAATTDACRRWCDRSWTRVVLPFSYTRDAPKLSPVNVRKTEREHPRLNPGLHQVPAFPIDGRQLPAKLNAKKPPDQWSRGSNRQVARRDGVERRLTITRRRAAIRDDLDG
jgi:hypothetical protein